MAAYRLAGPLAEGFEAVRGPFAAALGSELRLRLGGGTALALRWNHRRSTDLDFFFSYRHYPRVRDGAAALEAALLRAPGVQRVQMAAAPALGAGAGAECVVEGVTPVSFFPTDELTSRPVSFDTIAGSRVWLESAPEILAKKLVYRVAGLVAEADQRRFAPARDVYDLAYAARHQAEDFGRAAEAMPFNVLADALSHLRVTSAEDLARSGRPLSRLADGSLAFEARDVVVDALGRHLRARPSVRPDRDPPTTER